MDVKVDGLNAHWANGGRASNTDEPAVVLLHGAGLNRTVWQLQSRNIAYMGRQVFAVDLPGHGLSEGAPIENIEDMAEWVSRFMEAVDIGSVTLIGHSMGALLALSVAARYPDKAEKLVLMGIAETMPVHPDLLSAAKKNETLGPELIVYWGLGDKAQIGGHPHPGLWVHGASQTLLDLSKPNVLYTDLAACDAYGGALEAARNIKCPTRFILGANDKMTPPKKAQPLVSTIRGAEVHRIERSGHMMMTERPNQVYAALRGFV